MIRAERERAKRKAEEEKKKEEEKAKKEKKEKKKKKKEKENDESEKEEEAKSDTTEPPGKLISSVRIFPLVSMPQYLSCSPSLPLHPHLIASQEF